MGRPRVRRHGRRVSQIEMYEEAPSEALEWITDVYPSQLAAYPIDMDVVANAECYFEEAGPMGENVK